jgi:hypothetical protein
MRTAANIIGFILVGLGIIWLGQENGIIPGSFLSYEVRIDGRGMISEVLGIIILLGFNLGAVSRRR